MKITEAQLRKVVRQELKEAQTPPKPDFEQQVGEHGEKWQMTDHDYKTLKSIAEGLAGSDDYRASRASQILTVIINRMSRLSL